MPKRKLISFDWAMKKLLRSKANFEILEGFLSELLEDDIKILEVLESESNKKKNRRDKLNRVDLKVKNLKAKGLKKAKQELDILKLPEEERIAYESYQDDLHYQASMVESTYTIGMIKGRKERDVEIASNLISAGILDHESISKATGLSLDEIKFIKKL